MKRIAVLLTAALTLSILSGCMVTSPRDEEFRREFQEDRDEAAEELKRDRQEDRDDRKDRDRRDDDDGDGPWEDWDKAWEDWAEDWESRGEDIEDRFDDMEEKKHVWKIQDVSDKEAGAPTEIGEVTDRKLVDRLDDLLLDDVDDLDRLTEAPDDPAYSYVYSQEKTLLAGQDPKAEREYEDLLRFTVSASEDVVTMQILGGLEELTLLPGAVEMEDVLTFPIKVPAKTAEVLRNPGEFTK